ncbi:MAG: hypothetical protein ACYDHZ_02625 [Dehalococcoidia bacterium]
MCKNLIKNLLDAVYETVNDKPTGYRILEKLQNIEDELEHQGKVSLYLFYMTVGITFIGFSLAIKVANFTTWEWLTWLLGLGGLFLMGFAGLQFNEDINKKTALFGAILTVVGLVMTTIFVYNPTIHPAVIIIGLFAMLIGLISLIIASKPLKKISGHGSRPG